MWVEKSRNGGSTQADNASNPGEANQKKKTSSAEGESPKKESFVLVLQKPQKLQNNEQV